MIACLGGFCQERERCANYVYGDRSTESPSERLCQMNKEKVTLIKLGSEPVQTPSETETGA